VTKNNSKKAGNNVYQKKKDVQSADGERRMEIHGSAHDVLIKGEGASEKSIDKKCLWYAGRAGGSGQKNNKRY